MIFQDDGYDWVEITDLRDVLASRRVFVKGAAVKACDHPFYRVQNGRCADCGTVLFDVAGKGSVVVDRDQEIADQRSDEARDMNLHSPGCRGAFGVPCAEWCEVYAHNRDYGASLDTEDATVLPSSLHQDDGGK